MVKLIYNLCFFYKLDLFKIVEIPIDNILILANNNFASKEKAIIKVTKIIIKNQKYFTFI